MCGAQCSQVVPHRMNKGRVMDLLSPKNHGKEKNKAFWMIVKKLIFFTRYAD